MYHDGYDSYDNSAALANGDSGMFKFRCTSRGNPIDVNAS